jgi:PAS domain S-box-containing protein
LGIVIDITERKQAELAYEEEATYRRMLFEQSPDGIVIIDPQTARFREFNSAAHRQLGYSREEFAELTLFDVEAEETAEETGARIAAVIRDGEADFETLQRAREGEVRHVHVSARVVDVRGVPVYQCIWRDITERKQAEEELRTSEERNRRLVESLTDAILVHRGDFITFANPAALRLFRATAMEELVGKRYLDLVHPDDRAVSAERIRGNMEKGRVAPPREHRIIALDGAVVDIESTGVPFQHPEGTQVFGVLRDITARKQADLEKAKLETQLRQAQKMEAIGTLAGGIAHDFNNILSVIIGNAEMLSLSEAISTPTLEENVAPILAASSRAKKLVSQILAFSRQGEQQKMLTNLKPVIKETIGFMRSSLPATIQLNYYIHPEAGTILADPTQMQQILMNLCTNAAHAMEDGGGVLSIELDNVTLTDPDTHLAAGCYPGDYLKLVVSDTGHGMEAWVRERIFDPYFTTKGPGKGTGLGLSVVHGIVKSHGGMIKVDSAPGRGTTFSVYLPRTDGAERAMPQAAEPLPRGSERILLVDDEPELADLQKRMLEFLGYIVEVRTSPIEALEFFRTNQKRFDAIITDMTMPQITGLNLAREILAIQPELPIILCTGFSEQADEVKAHSAGIRAFLFKPIVIAELANSLRKALDEIMATDP